MSGYGESGAGEGGYGGGTASTNLIWSGQSDFDNAQHESGVHHSGPIGTDWAGSGTLEKGHPDEYDLTDLPTPIAYYPLNEDSGTYVNDVFGIRDMTNNGADVNVSGVAGSTGYDFFEDADRVTGVQHPELEQAQNISVSLWFKMDDPPDSSADRHHLFGYGATFTDYLSFLIFEGDNALDWHVENRNYSGSAAAEGNPSAGTITTGTWYHAVGTFDGSVPEATVYLNGTLQNSTTDAPTLTPPNDGTDFAIGNLPWTDRAHDGQIQDVILWDETLTQEDVTELYDAVVNTSTWWSTKRTETGAKSAPVIATDSTIPVGTSIDITLFEDVGNDQTGSQTDARNNDYDNKDTVTLSGGTDETNTLSGFDGGGTTNNYWVKVELSGDGSDPTLASPTLTSIEVRTSAATAVPETSTMTMQDNDVSITLPSAPSTQLQWSTTAEMDAGQSEENVHHAQLTGTDWAPDDAVEHGYPEYDQDGSSLVAYYTMDESSSATAIYDSRQTLDGSPTSIGSYDDTGIFGTALTFSRSGGSYIDLPADSAFELNEFSLSAWVSLSSSIGTADRARVFDNNDTTDGWYLDASQSGSANIEFGWTDGGGTRHSLDAAVDLIGAGWTHLLVSYVGGSDIRIYVDGTQEKTGSAGSAGITYPSTTIAPRIGRGRGGGGGFDGPIDEVRLYSRALKDADATRLFDVTSGNYVSSEKTS